MRILIFCLLFVSASFAATINQIGTYNNWATDWISLGGYDADDGVTENLDFVGDVSNPGLYYANNGEYLFFRMRVDADTFTIASGAHIVLIDVANYGVTGIDYAFAWDSKSNDQTAHGLEMCIGGINGPTWSASQVDDLDGLSSQKGTNDINGLISGSTYRTTDGYVRSIDGQSTINFGDTTFIDFAVSWSYLETYTDLNSNQTWNVSLASIANATDHNAFNADVSGASLTDLITAGWSEPVSVPEPSSFSLVCIAAVTGLLLRRYTAR